MGWDEEMLVCLSTLQSYCLLSVFARGVDNLFGDKTYCTKTIGGWMRQNSKTYSPIDTFNALYQDSLNAISLSFCSLDK